VRIGGEGTRCFQISGRRAHGKRVSVFVCVFAAGPIYTIADGIAVLKVGTLTSELCKELVDEYVTVTDEEICRT
jgi:threonine dehydratase